jgi:hypothetical protein
MQAAGQQVPAAFFIGADCGYESIENMTVAVTNQSSSSIKTFARSYFDS